VRAPADGVVADVHVAKGQHVENGTLLLVFEPADGPGSPDSSGGEDGPGSPGSSDGEDSP
jgi:pyruvate/2-oxoglutarate dehydrogenase complex dihydrolipoamide acyltransferase (E2) component